MALKRKKTLAALVGTAAAGILMATVANYEGEYLTTYKDPVGIDTVCYGDTDPEMAIPGVTYSRVECLKSLERQLVNHAEPVLKIVPTVKESPEMTAAFVSLTYNIGPGAFKKSTVVKRFKAGDYAGACEAIKMWNKAGGKVLKGLVRRREGESELCKQGIPAMEAWQDKQILDRNIGRAFSVEEL